MCILWMRYLWISLIEVRPVLQNSLLYIKSGRSECETIAERFCHGIIPRSERPDFIYNRPVWLEPIALLLAILFWTDTGILLIPALLIPGIVPLSVIIFLATLFHYRGHFSPEIVKTLVIITRARLWRDTGKLDAVNPVRLLFICRALSHLS